MAIDLVDTLCSLVSIPSVNPMGKQVSGKQYLEHAMTDRLQGVFDSLGLVSERQEVEPQRANILARLDGEVDPLEGGTLLVFEAHQDTVPVEGMTIPPWTPEVREEKVFGRGACDIKGGMACMLTALSRLADERPRGMPTIVMACSVNEEHGFSGAMQMADAWRDGKSKLVPKIPDAVIVAEPTELNVVVSHKGVVRWKCHTSGRACHSSMPEQGDNAIYRMAKVIALLEQYATEIAPSHGEHPLVGRPTLSVGIISGGISVNTVPDQCTIEIDRRVLPGEDAAEARQRVIDFVTKGTDGDPQIQHEAPFIITNGLDNARNQQLAAKMTDAANAEGCPGLQTGVPYGTDAPAFDAVGAPTVVFGPGSVQQAHTRDEWVAIDQLHRATEAYFRFAMSAG